MKKRFQYLRYLLRHKYFVLREGIKLGVPLWRLILHDWTKFLPKEWTPYCDWFYGGWRQNHYSGESHAPAPLKDAYDAAWCHHMHKNDHHWQFWLMTFDDGNSKALPMSNVACLEMLADWKGAGLALGKPDTAAWYAENKSKMMLHPRTRLRIEYMLSRE